MLVLVLYPNWILQTEARTSRECWYLFYIQTGYSSQRPGRPENVGTCSISKLDTPVRGQDVLNVGTCSISKLDTGYSSQRPGRPECWYLFYIQTGYSSQRPGRPECWYLFYIQTGYSSQRPGR